MSRKYREKMRQSVSEPEKREIVSERKEKSTEGRRKEEREKRETGKKPSTKRKRADGIPEGGEMVRQHHEPLERSQRNGYDDMSALPGLTFVADLVTPKRVEGAE